MVVTDLEVDEQVPARTARIVANNLVVELRKLKGYSVLGMEEVRTLMEAEANRQSMGCSEGTSCLNELADALGADVVVAGRIGTFEGATTFSLRRIDSVRATVVGTYEERLVQSGGSELLAAIGPAVEKLFPDGQLRDGSTRGVAAEQARVLHPPPVPTLATVATIAGAVGAGATAAVFAVLANQAIASADALLSDPGDTPISGAVLAQHETDARNASTAAVVAGAVGGGLLLGAGILALFTDWTGAGAVEP